jgi:hypothetical protein
MAIIEQRSRILVNTDPQRRCYDGCHYSSELQWTEWVDFESGVSDNDTASRLDFWRGLNDYAVEARGKSARSEYRLKRSA